MTSRTIPFFFLLALLCLPFSGGAKDQNDINSSLIKAVIADDISSVERFIEQGADLEYEDTRHRTALLYAAAQRNEAMIAILISHGAKIDGNVPNGLTSLMIACEKDDYEISRQLIKSGANVNAVTYVGEGLPYTPLLASVSGESPNEQIVEMLLRSGAAKDKQGVMNALSLAKHRRLDDIVKILTADAGRVEVFLTQFSWETVKGLLLGLLIASCGLLVYPLVRSFRDGTTEVKILRVVFWTQIGLHGLFIAGVIAFRIMTGWEPTGTLILKAFLSYYFAFIGILGFLISIVVLLARRHTREALQSSVEG